MKLARQFYELEEMEDTIASSKTALLGINNQIGDRSALVLVEEKVNQKRTELKSLESEQKAKEWEIEDLEVKITALNKKLYGGKSIPHKELLSMQQEMEQLKTRKVSIEDTVLELMGKIETLKRDVAQQEKDFTESENKWKESQDHLVSEKGRLENLINILEQKRLQVISAMHPRDIELYKDMKSSHGSAVAKVEQGRCLGCRIHLPADEIRRARTEEEVIFCSSCGRILFLS